MSRLFIPLEIVQRELIGKTLVATYVASKGIPVIIGHKGAVFKKAIDQGSQGILFYKSATDRIRIPFQNRGFAVVAQDEESGIAMNNFEDFYHLRKAHRNTQELDQYYCWGEEEYNYFTKQLNYSDNTFMLTGSPRTVLWGELGKIFYQDEIKKIYQFNQNYILIATSLDLIHFYHGDVEPTLQKVYTEIYGESWNAQEKENFLLRYDYQKKLKKILINLCNEILNKTDYNIIIRPHPVEDPKNWEKVFRDNNRIRIMAEGDSTPLVLAARCVVHDGTTVGIESAVSNVPNLTFSKKVVVRPTSFRHLTPLKTSITVNSIQEMIEKIRQIEKYWPEKKNSINQILNFKLYKPGTANSIFLIGDNIVEMSKKIFLEKSKKFKIDIPLEIYIAFLQLKKPINFHVGRQHRQKRPKIHQDFLESLVLRAREMMSIKELIEVSRTGPSCFEIRLSDIQN